MWTIFVHKQLFLSDEIDNLENRILLLNVVIENDKKWMPEI